MPRFAPPGAFAREIRARGTALIRRQPNGRFADCGQLARVAFFALLTTALYAALLIGGPIPSALLALMTGISAFLFAAAAAHDAAHGALVRNKTVNRLVTFFSFGLFGISGALWALRHVRLHHMFPNVVGTEIDHDSTSLLRLSHHAEWRPWHRIQAFYSPFVYMLLFPFVAFVEDFKWWRQARRERPEFVGFGPLAEFVASKIFHVALVVVPAMILQLSPLQIAAGYLLAIGIPSLIFASLVVGTHIAEEVVFSVPDEQDRLAHDWATHQMLTSVDWSPDNRLLTVITGAANTHTAHHLFPEAANCHARMLNDLVAEMVAKHGVRRNVMSFGKMVLSHIRHLATLSRMPQIADA